MKIKKYIISLFVLSGLVGFGASALAQEGVDESGVDDLPISITIAQASDVVMDDEDVGILPTSPWYFLKEWRRGIQKFFTFSEEGKAELEIDFADEKANELKKVAANNPEDARGIENAVTNYLDAKELLEARFTSLTKNLNDQNREKAEQILDKWDAKIDAHKALFDGLAERHSDLPVMQEVGGAIDWAMPLIKFRGNLDDLSEQVRRTMDTDEFRGAVKEIEDLKSDIEEGSKKPARSNCSIIESDIEMLKNKLIGGKISGPDFAREFGILQNELVNCAKK